MQGTGNRNAFSKKYFPGNIPAWKTAGRMATKVNPWNGKGLGKDSVRNQFTTSLSSLKVEKVHILYLHAPDHDTPLVETLTEINELHKEGKFEELGLSNFSSWVSFILLTPFLGGLLYKIWAPK